MELVRVAVESCSGTLAEAYPEQALVRLHHFARKNGASAIAAQDALAGLVQRDDRLFRRFLDRVTVWHSPVGVTAAVPAPAARPPHRRDPDLFLALVNPYRLTAADHRRRRLIDDPSVRARLVQGWGIVLAHRSHEAWADTACLWLQACADDPSCEPLLDILVEASLDSFADVSRLYVLARDWARAADARPSSRTPIAESLSRKFDAAQGLVFTDIHSDPKTEENVP
jgi:hypothetical protein